MFSEKGERLKLGKRPELSAEDRQIVADLIATTNNGVVLAEKYYGQLVLADEPVQEQLPADLIEGEEPDYGQRAA